MKITIKNSGVEWIVKPENEDNLNEVIDYITDCICDFKRFIIIDAPDTKVILTQQFLQNSLIVITK
jgi:hypothetical protein